MSPIARVKEQPKRAKSLVFSMMMIMSAFSAGIPLASAAGQNGEWIQVDMSQGHWDAGDTVDATISGGSLDSIPGYTVEWKLENMNSMTVIDNGTETISAPASGDTFEYDLSFESNNLSEDCFNLIGDLFDNGGAFVDGSSMSFDVGVGMCQSGPSGPHIWWNGSSWFDTDESVVFFAEAEGLDEAEGYTLQWEVLDDQSNQVGSGSEDLSMVGQESSIEILVGQLGDACYEIKGMLEDSDSKPIGGSDASFMFEVGNGTCQTGPPSMIDAYVNYYDGTLEISSYGYEADQSSLNIQVSILDAAGMEIYGLDMDFTADEYGMFAYSDASQTFEDGEYAMEVKVTNLTDDSILFEGTNMTLYVNNGGGGHDGPTISAWLEGQPHSGDEIFVGYYIDSGTGGGQGGDGPTFVCGNGDEIDFSWVNDGDEDCVDGSDEPQDMDSSADSDGDGNYTNDHDSWFDCNDANESTVNMDVVNDGNWDCENGADEGEAAGPPEGEGAGPFLSATLNLYNDEDNTLLSTHHLDMNESNISLGMLGDGDYKVEVILEEIDAEGDAWEVDSDGFNLCLGADCESGGPTDMMTGNATLDLLVTFDDYDSDNCMGGVVMLFDWYDLYTNMMGNEEGDEEGNDGPEPVWYDWQTVSSPGEYTLTGLPEGDWVVIVTIGCEDPATGQEYSAMNFNGPWNLLNTTFVNDTRTSLDVDLQIMDEGGDGDDMDYETGEVEFTIRVDDSADGSTSLTMTTKVGMSDFLRDDIDCAFGNCDGEVDATEAANAILMFEMMGSDGGDDGGDEHSWEFYDDCSFDADADRMNDEGEGGLYWCSDEDTTEGDEDWWYWCEPTPEGDYRCTDDFGHNGQPSDEKDDGPPPLMWNGVLLTEGDIISENMEVVGLVGMVPADETEDTGSIQMVMTVVYSLSDSGDATQVLSMANEPEDGVDEGPGEEDQSDCDTLDIYFKDSTTWKISSIDNDDDYFTHDAAAGYHHGTFTCEDSPSENMTVSYTRVVADEPEPEPPVNTAPTCDVYWYGSDDDLDGGKESGHEADDGTQTGDFDIELTEGATYTLMFYCTDAEGDEITVTVDPPIGANETMTGSGNLSGYYKFTIPSNTAELGEMSFDYDWTDGTNSDDGTVSVKVLEGTATDDTKSDDTSAGSFVPGFTAVLTMTALAGAFLVFSRREEE